MDKYAVAAIRGGHLVRHLKKGASAEFAKTILFFLKCDENNICWVEVNLGNGDWMQIFCMLHFKGKKFL